MTNAPTELVPGDTVTLTIKGRITDPGKAGTPAATTLRIYRPARPGWATTAPEVRMDAIFGADAVIDFTVESQFKNGVHLDRHGRYWMRRPGGWHEMTVSLQPVPKNVVPDGAQRLKEDKTR